MADEITPQNKSNALPDLTGAPYTAVMRHLHDVLRPNSYFEIGTDLGFSLALSSCPSVAVDPAFKLDDLARIKLILAKPAMAFYRMPSDTFFEQYDLTAILGRKVDIAFLDGMHRCEFLLRDFYNIERHCKPNSIIAVHDCLPVEEAITYRKTPGPGGASAVTSVPYRHNWWTGDVWRTALLLKRVRPDLHITALDAQPSGLLLITNLNPDDDSLRLEYADHVRAIMSWRLSAIGLAEYFAEMEVEPTVNIQTEEQLTARFWL